MVFELGGRFCWLILEEVDSWLMVVEDEESLESISITITLSVIILSGKYHCASRFCANCHCVNCLCVDCHCVYCLCADCYGGNAYT